MEYSLNILDNNKNVIGTGIMFKRNIVLRRSDLKGNVPAFIEYKDKIYSCVLDCEIKEKDLAFLHTDGDVIALLSDGVFKVPLVEYLIDSINMNDFNAEEAKFIKLFSITCYSGIPENIMNKIFKGIDLKVAQDLCDKGWIYKDNDLDYSMNPVIFYILKHKYPVDYSEVKDFIKSIREKFEKNQETKDYLLCSLSILHYFEEVIDIEIALLSIRAGETANIFKQFDDSIEYLNRAMKIMKKINDKDYKGIARIYNNIGYVYRNRAERDYKKAFKYHLKALDMDKKRLQGEEDINAALTQFSIGAVYYSMNDCKTALDYLFKALKIVDKISGENDFNAAKIYDYIGHSYTGMGNYDEAMKYFLKALNIKKRIYRRIKNHEELAKSYEYIAANYESQNKLKDSIEYYQKGIIMLRDLYAGLFTRVYKDGKEIKVLNGVGMGFLLSNIGLLEDGLKESKNTLIKYKKMKRLDGRERNRQFFDLQIKRIINN